MRWGRWIAVFALVAALGSCAGYDDNFYVHSVWRPKDGAAAQVNVFYLTDRARNRYMPGGFDYRRAAAPSCGMIAASVPAAKLPAGEPVFAKELGRSEMGCGSQAAGLISAIAEEARSRRCGAVLLYVHGFDTGFETDVLRAAQMGSDTLWPCAVASFSWASTGQRGEYEEDVARLTAAEPLLREFLVALAHAGIETDIVAHSLGARLTLATLAGVSSQGVLAHQVLLAAPDISEAGAADGFAALYQRAAPHLRHLTIYASREDVALALSARENSGTPRIGRDPHAARAGANVDVIDASDAPGDLIGHNYYDLSHEMLADMSLALAGVPASERLTPRGDQPPTLVAGSDPASYRLNVPWDRAPDPLTRLLRWLITLVAG